MSKPFIKKIIIELSGKEYSLTPAEAKELHQALGELFNKEKEYVGYPAIPWVNPVLPLRPYYADRVTCVTSNTAKLKDASVIKSVCY